MADPFLSKGKKRERSSTPDANKFKKSSTSSRLRKLDRAAYEKLTVFNAPCKLVENGPDGKLKTCEEVLKQLRQIESPLNIISITGPYRTGKSYILNYLAGKRRGFPLGSTVLAETKGIWVWCQSHPKRQDEVLLLLDTEGLGDIKKGDAEKDTWIFTLSVLLSSTLVYNCKSSITLDGLSQLHNVTELTKQIKQRQASKAEDGREFFTFFPNFVWIVRDFTLDLKDKEGKLITSDQYLLDALQLKEDETPDKDDYNRPRQCIQQYFADKKCFVFPPPVYDWRQYNELERLSDSQLDSMFLQEAKELCSYIHTQSFPKTAECQPIQGKMFCDLLETYLQSIQTGDIPCVENAVKIMAEKENADAVKASFNAYKDLMEKIPLKSINTEKELIDAHLQCYGKAIETFMSMSILDEKGNYQQQMKENISQKFKQILKEWEQHHRESESANGDPELENERKLVIFKELHQDIFKMQEKASHEQENRIQEFKRRSMQRQAELIAIRENQSSQPEMKDGLLNILSGQANHLDCNKENMERDLQEIIKGGASFGNYLVRAGRIIVGMSTGAAWGLELGSLSGNPIVMAVFCVFGCIVGGFKQFHSTQNRDESTIAPDLG